MKRILILVTIALLCTVGRPIHAQPVSGIGHQAAQRQPAQSGPGTAAVVGGVTQKRDGHRRRLQRYSDW
ncbi:MAG: hypothetical protein R2932_20985 [Caldilineaceae bacterium]